MDKISYFESPFGMFKLTGEVFFRYYKNASAPDFLLLVFLLYHLREHIVAGQDHDEIKRIPLESRTDEQNIFIKLWEMASFKIIRQLCNGSKHHRIDIPLHEIEGLRCGLSRAGDRLGQKYFLVDGKDSRDIFAEVFTVYKSYFEKYRTTIV